VRLPLAQLAEGLPAMSGGPVLVMIGDALAERQAAIPR